MTNVPSPSTSPENALYPLSRADTRQSSMSLNTISRHTGIGKWQALRSPNQGRIFISTSSSPRIRPCFFRYRFQNVGIDVGISNLATTSGFVFFKGVKSRIARFQRLRSALQSKGTASARKHLKRLSGAQTRFMRSVNHWISKRIVSGLDAGDIIVMENLHGIRERRRGRSLNRLLSNWAFLQLKCFVEYKAVRKGVVFCSVSHAYTSMMYNRCHEIDSIRPKKVGFFKCLNCGYSFNTDLNASFNLRDRADALRNALGLFVNQPIVGNRSDKPMPLGMGS